MYWFLLDHFQRFVVILNCDMSSINICMKLFKAKPDIEALFLYICISNFNISKHFTNKGYVLVVLEVCSAEAIFTGISLQDKGLGVIIVIQVELRSVLQIQNFKQ